MGRPACMGLEHRIAASPCCSELTAVSLPAALPPALTPAHPPFTSRLQVKIDYRPVHLQPLTSDMEHIPPKARVY